MNRAFRGITVAWSNEDKIRGKMKFNIARNRNWLGSRIENYEIASYLKEKEAQRKLMKVNSGPKTAPFKKVRILGLDLKTEITRR
jgi:hypothetical protein